MRSTRVALAALPLFLAALAPQGLAAPRGAVKAQTKAGPGSEAAVRRAAGRADLRLEPGAGARTERRSAKDRKWFRFNREVALEEADRPVVAQAITHAQKTHGEDWRLARLEKTEGVTNKVRLANKSLVKRLFSRHGYATAVVDHTGKIIHHEVRPGVVRSLLTNEYAMATVGGAASVLLEHFAGIDHDSAQLILVPGATLVGAATAKFLDRRDQAEENLDRASEAASAPRRPPRRASSQD